MSRVRSNFITNRLADGAPTASLGLIISGVTTSTTLNVDDKIVHTGDTNTAIRFPATDTITAETSGTERLRISSDGKIGIGTDSPDSDAYIHIVGQDNGKIILEDNSNNGANLRKNYIGIENSDNLVLAADEDNLGSSSAIKFRIDGDEKTRITSNGLIGIGTDNPGSEIHLSKLGASDEPTIKISSENSSIFLRTAGSSGAFPTGGVGNDGELVYIGGDFRFGVGTASKNLIFFNGSGYTERLRITSAGHLKHTNSSGSTIHTLKRSNANTTGAFGTLNFAASDDHSVANITAQGDGDNEGANLIFRTTTAAASEDPYDASLVERLRIGSTGYISGNINIPAWFGRQDAAHNVTTGTWTAIINLGNDVVNPSMNNGGWDESTGTFTVQAGQAGTYYVFGQVGIDDIQSDDIVRAGISKNDGTPGYFGEQRAHAGEANQIYQAYVARVLSVAVGDTIKLKVYHNESTTEPTEPNRCYFGGYRIAV